MTESQLLALQKKGLIKGFTSTKMVKPIANSGKCVGCGEYFIVTKEGKEYCNKKCYLKRYNKLTRPPIELVNRNCDLCGNEFLQTKATQIFCSKKCTDKKHSQKHATGLGRQWAVGKEFVDRKLCITCGNLFYSEPGRANRSENAGKFCSRKCYGVHSSNMNADKFKELRTKKEIASRETKQEKDQPVKTPCKFCGNDSVRDFCNQQCYVAYKKSLVGKNNIVKQCLNCGIDITVTPGQHNAGFGKFCSSSCSSVHRIKETPGKQYGNSVGGKRSDLNNMYFRSRWEANYARYLNFLIKQGTISKWEYEPDTYYFESIKRGIRSYTPDFKIFVGQSFHYVEIKGYMDDKSQTKLNRMKKFYPQYEIQLVDQPRYKSIHESFKRIIPNWETDGRYK